MHERKPSVVLPWLAVAVALGLAIGACGSDDDDAEPAPSEAASDADSTGSGDATSDGGDIEGSVTDDDLLVPRGYLQGEWCDSDGSSWSIEGDTALVEESGSGGTVEIPVDLVFLDSVDSSLVSQTDDEFVIESSGDEVTFTRGSC